MYIWLNGNSFPAGKGFPRSFPGYTVGFSLMENNYTVYID